MRDVPLDYLRLIRTPKPIRSNQIIEFDPMDELGLNNVPNEKNWGNRKL